MSAGRSLRSRASCSACRLPTSWAIRTVGGSDSSARSASSRAANQAGSQRTRASTTGSVACVGRTGTARPRRRRAGAGQRRRGRPPPQRLLGRVEGRPVEGRPGVQQQRRRVAAVGHRLGPGRGDDQAGAAVDPGEHLTGARGVHRHPGEGPAQLLGGAPRARPRWSAGSRPPQCGHSNCCRHRAAPAARRRRARGAERQRPRAARAARGLATGLAGQRGQVAAARHLDQHRAALERGLGRAPGRRGQVGHRGRAVALDVGALTGHEHPGRGAAYGAGAATTGCTSPASTQRCTRRGAGEAAGQQGGALGAGPQRQHLAHVGVGRARLGRAGRHRRPTRRRGPRSCTGANAAARVPTTQRTWPRSTFSQAV